MKKTFTTLLAIGILLGLSSCNSNQTQEDEVKCDSSNEGYNMGYKSGKTSRWETPEEHKRECNNGVGMIGKVPPCWDEGFRAAKQ